MAFQRPASPAAHTTQLASELMDEGCAIRIGCMPLLDGGHPFLQLRQGPRVIYLATLDVVKIKELMGHASIVTTMRYIHATDQGKRGAITVLSEYRQQRRQKAGHKLVTTRKAAGPIIDRQPAAL